MNDSKKDFSHRAMLVGSPRSGTTWLAKIIDSHPSVLYRHEPDKINRKNDIPFVPQKDEVATYLDDSRHYLAEMAWERSSESSGSQPMFSKGYRRHTAEILRRAIILSLKSGERLLGRNGLLQEFYVPDLINRGSENEALLFIKSVSSLCRTYMFSISDPGMQFIHVIRHPCAYVSSTLRGNRLGLLNDEAYIDTLANMPESEQYGLTLEKLKTMSPEQQLAARWMLQNEKVCSEMEGCSRYFRVIYEELCINPMDVATGVLAFLGLPMDEQTAQFIADSSSHKNSEARYFDLKRDSAEAASGWLRELTPEKIEQIRDVVAQSSIGKLYFTD